MFGDNGEDDIEGYGKNSGVTLSDVQFVLLGAVLGVAATMLYCQVQKFVLKCREGRDTHAAMISAASDIAGMPVDNECGMLGVSGLTSHNRTRRDSSSYADFNAHDNDPNQYLVASATRQQRSRP